MRSKWNRGRFLGLLVLVLGLGPGRRSAAQDVVINEISAVNDTVLADRDGDFPDWIELFNAGAVAVDLGGWYLSDDATELTLFRLPTRVLGPGQYLVVFASGKDRAPPLGEIHTNFRLDSGPAWLALVEPGGARIHFAFDPAYPAQYSDISWGLEQGGVVLDLIAEGQAGAVLVPTDSSLGTGWRAPGFDDSAWRAGSSAIGYDLGPEYDEFIGTDLEASMRGKNASACVRIPFDVADPATVSSLVLEARFDDGFVAWLNGREVVRRNALGFITWNTRATVEHGDPVIQTVAQDFDSAGLDYVLTAHGAASPPEVLGGGPSGNFLRLMPDGVGSLANTIGFARGAEPAAGIDAHFDFRMPTEADHTGCCGERADGFAFALVDTSVYGASGPGPTAAGVVWERPAFPNVFAVGFDIFDGTGDENTVTVYWNGVEVGAVRVGEFPLNAGQFHGCDIQVRPSGSDSLVTVRLTPNALGAVPGAPVVVFDSLLVRGMGPFDNRLAFGGRTGGAFTSVDLDNIEITYSPGFDRIPLEDHDLSAFTGELVAGRNVLALQGLNVRPDDDDFLLSVVLEATVGGAVQRDVRKYFDAPTPGGPNIGGWDGVAEAPRFSEPGGTFTGGLSVELSVDSPAASIRYTTNRSEPTSTSTLYTGAIDIADTTIVKAKVFEEGLLPGPTVTQGYVELAANAAGFQSNLPLMVVDTFRQGIGQGAYVWNEAVFIDVDPASGRSRITDSADHEGRAGIRLRGSSSLGFPKKQFAFETWDERSDDLDVPVLGFPSQSDWVVYAPYSDKALMRNVLAYDWSNQIGRYAPRTRFVELFLNTGAGPVAAADYAGVYVFMEKIKRDNDRVDVHRLDPSDAAEPDITGGYILKKDRLDPGDSGLLTSHGQRLGFVYPKEREITAAQRNYIVGYLNQFEAALYGTDFADPETGYAAYIDADSFIDHHIMTELCKNIDGYRLSTFMYKDRGGKLFLGPIWDYNLSLGNANYLQGWLPQGWYYPLINSDQYPWFPRLFEDPEFEQRYVDRWTAFRKTVIVTDRLLDQIDATALFLDEAQQRNFQRWPVLGKYVWPNWYIASTYPEEITWMKGWLTDRIAWIDSNWPRVPASDPPGGLVSPGVSVSLSAAVGTIYYTTDGSDPRLAGGGVSPSATAYGTGESLLLAGEGVTPEIRVLVPTDGADGVAWTMPGFDDSSWTRGTNAIGVGYERGSGYQTLIDVDVRDQMAGIATTVYVRVPFDVVDPGAVDSLVLRMKYDDGFAAYINGELVASGNAPAALAWDSSATALHDDAAAVVFEEHDISAHIGALVAGRNVLALHGLNDNTGSSDLLVRPELVAGSSVVGDAFALSEPTFLRARTRSGSAWSGLAEEVFVFDTDLPLRVTEVHYHPASVEPESPWAAKDFEFLEVANIGAVPVDLTGVRFTLGVEFDFTTGALKRLLPGARLVVVSEQEAFATVHDTSDIAIAGEYSGNLSNAGETIRLEDGAGNVIQQFAFDDLWYPETDGVGYALAIIDPRGDPALWGAREGWGPGSTVNGTPGEPEVVQPPTGGLQRSGDANQDSAVDLSDAVSILRILFVGGAALPCDGGAATEGGNRFVLDANGDTRVDLSDAVHLLEYLFLGDSGPAGGTACRRVEGCPDACVF